MRIMAGVVVQILASEFFSFLKSEGKEEARKFGMGGGVNILLSGICEAISNLGVMIANFSCVFKVLRVRQIFHGR